MRYIIRPKHIFSTPRQFKELLGAKRTKVWPYSDGTMPYKPSLKEDFFFIYPHPMYLNEWGKDREAVDKYTSVYNFSRCNKFWQRKKMEESGLPIITSSKTPNDPSIREAPYGYVVRPDRHSGGIGYRLTDNPSDFRAEDEYISVIFPKHAEYRLIFFFGKFCCLYKKVVDDNLKKQPEAAWNHAQGSNFVTINWEGSNISHHYPNFIQQLESIPYIQHSHLCGIDILWRSPNLKVCEINFSPGITIDGTFEKLKEIYSHVQS